MIKDNFRLSKKGQNEDAEIREQREINKIKINDKKRE